MLGAFLRSTLLQRMNELLDSVAEHTIRALRLQRTSERRVTRSVSLPSVVQAEAGQEASAISGDRPAPDQNRAGKRAERRNKRNKRENRDHDSSLSTTTTSTRRSVRRRTSRRRRDQRKSSGSTVSSRRPERHLSEERRSSRRTSCTTTTASSFHGRDDRGESDFYGFARKRPV